MGDIARARQYFSQVEGQARRDLAEVEAETDGDPRDLANVLQDMADIELGLGRTDAAVQLTRRAQATVDGFEDKYSIAVWSGVNADLYSRIGRADLAVPLLDRILASPNGGMAYSSALLPSDPSWDPIRADPRFIALLTQYPAPGVLRSAARRVGQEGGSTSK